MHTHGGDISLHFGNFVKFSVMDRQSEEAKSKFSYNQGVNLAVKPCSCFPSQNVAGLLELASDMQSTQAVKGGLVQDFIVIFVCINIEHYVII